ncbi:MAG: DUF2027 domain-containing protein [Prevotella sp.]|nr:DUF2027 domain-containing protein [Prevotella sp.]
MKIGDKVRFLNETGGGRVTGFKKGNIVLVEDEDGFEIPVLISNVVAVESDDYGTPKPVAPPQKPADNDEDYDPADREVTFKAPVEERKGGDKLSAYLAFVPANAKEFTTTSFDCYFVNDSNYYLRYVCLRAENGNAQLWREGETEPNTKELIAGIRREELNDFDRLTVQAIAYKRGKPYIPKPVINVQLRFEAVKFYKLHTFAENDFFEQPALLYTIVENDIHVRPLVVDPKELQKEMMAKRADAEPKKIKEVRRKGKDEVVVIDLHAGELLETTAGMSNGDILNYQLKVFNDTLAEYGAKKGQKIIFIHGKGEGVLRRSIINQLNYKYKKYQYQDASFAEYGYGATQVTIK